MANKRLSATYAKGNQKIDISVEVLTWSEDGISYYYSPALDLVGYGTNDQEARQSFETFLDEFVDYTHAKRTIFDELERLGWKVNRRKRRFQPPDKSELIEDNDEYRQLISRSDISPVSRQHSFAI